MKPHGKNAGHAAREVAAGRPDLMAIVAHEIKTPLAGIAGLLRLMEAEPIREKRYAYLQAALKSAELAGSLMNDLLDDAQLNAGQLSIESHSFCPSKLISDVDAFWRPQVQAKGLEFGVCSDAASEFLVGDAHRIRQMLDNLLSNALKHTDWGLIQLRSELQPNGDWLLEVIDSGCGIAPENYEQVFKPFQQFDRDAARSSVGTGLGLSIVYQLAQSMGGQVGFNSGLESGTVFRIRLPLPHAKANDQLEGSRTAKECNAAQPKGRVLVVEDEPVNRMITRVVLERLGYQPITVVSGEEALEEVASGSFDAILMDIELPGISGLETAQQIHATLGKDMIPPIIGLTAHNIAELGGRYSCPEFKSLLEKPIDPDAIEDLLQ